MTMNFNSCRIIFRTGLRELTINRFIFWMILSLLTLSPKFAHASEYRLTNGRIILEGEIIKKDLFDALAFVRLAGEIDQVEFRDSLGSPGFSGIIVDKIESLAKERKLKTFARGTCASTCAYAFLMGETRTLLPELGNQWTHLMIHVFRGNKTKEIDYGLTDRSFSKIVARSGGRFPLKLLERIYDDSNGTGDGELYIFREPYTTNRGIANVLVCQGKKIVHLKECEPVLGVALEDLGITYGE